MNPVKFNGANVIFAKDQPQYRQLPAFVNKEGEVLTEWAFSDQERAAIERGENLRIHTMTFNHPFQPVKPYIQSVDAPDEHADQNRAKESYPVESEAKTGLTGTALLLHIEKEKMDLLKEWVQKNQPENYELLNVIKVMISPPKITWHK